jgi:hypothetical protein
MRAPSGFKTACTFRSLDETGIRAVGKRKAAWFAARGGVHMYDCKRILRTATLIEIIAPLTFKTPAQLDVWTKSRIREIRAILIGRRLPHPQDWGKLAACVFKK